MTSLPTRRARITTSRPWSGLLLLGLFITWSQWAAAVEAGAEKVILVVGDSLSAGFGIPLAEAWPSLLGTRLTAAGYPYRVVNASISGDTTAGGARRIAPLLEEHRPAVVILALGANDALRGLKPNEVRRNLDFMLGAVLRAGAVPLLLKLRVPPNYGPQYTAALEGVYEDMFKRADVVAGPFMLEGFATDPAAFQADGLHPVAARQPDILATLWPSIESALAAAGQRNNAQ